MTEKYVKNNVRWHVISVNLNYARQFKFLFKFNFMLKYLMFILIIVFFNDVLFIYLFIYFSFKRSISWTLSLMYTPSISKYKQNSLFMFIHLMMYVVHNFRNMYYKHKYS